MMLVKIPKHSSVREDNLLNSLKQRRSLVFTRLVSEVGFKNTGINLFWQEKIKQH